MEEEYPPEWMDPDSLAHDPDYQQMMDHDWDGIPAPGPDPDEGDQL